MINSLAAAWIAAVALAAVDAVWALAVGIGLLGVLHQARDIVVAITAAIVFRLIERAADWFEFRLVVKASQRIATAFDYTAVLVALGNVIAILSYLLFKTRMPLVDEQLAGVDAILGFNWVAWFDFVGSHPWLRLSLWYLYASTGAAVSAALFYLIFTGRVWRYQEMLWVFTVTGIGTVLISGFLPALHAPAYYLSANHPSILGNSFPFLPDLFALHEGNFFTINLDKPQGLVCFPSFHTVLVIIFCYGLRGTWLFWPAVVLGGLTMPSLPPVGGHYLIDIPAGAAVALLAILVVRCWSPERAALRISTGVPAPGPVAADQPPAEAIMSKNRSKILIDR